MRTSAIVGRGPAWARGVLLCLPWVVAACGGAPEGGGEAVAGELACTARLDGQAVLGFETPAGWAVRRATAAATPVRTEGEAALELARGAADLELRSARVGGETAGLAGLDDPGAALALDVMRVARPGVAAEGGCRGAAFAELSVEARSRGLREARLGRADLGGLRPGLYQTVRFPLPEAVRSALAGGAFDDLTVGLRLHGADPRCGGFRLDHLRVSSPAAPLPGPGRSIDLLAQAGGDPPVSLPAEASFPVGRVQVPAALRARRGSAAGAGAELALGHAGVALTRCAFRDAGDGVTLLLEGCTGGAAAGDLLGASWARLALAAGPSGALKVLAQLALDPAGDLAGAGLLPPMPTWWGATPEEASAIATAYFQQLEAQPRTGERWIRAPTPDLALAHGDGVIFDRLTGPFPVTDPPFDKEGHMEPGGAWDGYWRLAGGLDAAPSASGDRALVHFQAELSTHAVLWGEDVTIARLLATADTDSGAVSADGFAGSAASGALHVYLFGVELPGGGASDASSGFSYTLDRTDRLDLPPIRIWIFAITLGVSAQAGVTAAGTLSPAGIDLGFTPQATLGAHLEGGVDVVVASGGVAADIHLLRIALPVTASAGWTISTNPATCQAVLGYVLDGQVTMGALGGEVDLVAKFGVCPLCDHESWTIFHWPDRDLGTRALFHEAQAGQVFALPAALCQVPLQAHIQRPAGDARAMQGVPYRLSGSAVRPGTAVSGGIKVATPVPCEDLTWTSSDPADAGFPATGCTADVTFATAGDRTVTLTAADAYGETGSAQASLTVVAPTPGPHPQITQVAPAPGLPIWDHSDVVLEASSVGGTAPVTYQWFRLEYMGTLVYLGAGTPFTFTVAEAGGYQLVLRATDADGRAGVDTIGLMVEGLPR